MIESKTWVEHLLIRRKTIQKHMLEFKLLYRVGGEYSTLMTYVITQLWVPYSPTTLHRRTTV